MTSFNDIATLESMLNRLDRIVGIGASHTTKVTATYARVHTVKGGSKFLASIAAPLVRSATRSLLSSEGITGTKGSGFSG